jgi:hypothetical protein
MASELNTTRIIVSVISPMRNTLSHIDFMDDWEKRFSNDNQNGNVGLRGLITVTTNLDVV